MRPLFEFTADLFEADAEAAWVFALVPIDVADEIETAATSSNSFGSIRVDVRVGDVAWKTSLFPDRKAQSFVLPVKREIRDRAGIQVGDTVRFALVVMSG